jgi:hypothetical protein
MFGVIRPFAIGIILLRTGRYYILISWFLINLVSQPLGAQFLPNNPERFELIIPGNDPGYDVIPAKEYGLVLYRTLNTTTSDQLEIVCTDTAFTVKWKGFLPVKKFYRISQYAVADGVLFLIFYRPNSSDHSFQLFQVDLKTGNYSGYEILNSIPFAPTTFEVTKHGAIIGGYFVQVPVILFFNFLTLRANILPGLFNETGELAQIKVNPDNTFNLLISSKNSRNQKTIWIKSYTADGSLIKNLTIDPAEGYQLISGSVVQTKDNIKIIAGAYSARNLDYSHGIFISKIYDSGDQYTQYYNFSDLKNFFQYLNPNRQKRIMNKIARKKERGKKLKSQHRFLVHNLVPFKDQFVLVGESFTTKYRQNERIGGYGFGSTYSNLVFDGYQYIHAIVLGIDNMGNLLWDNSFEIRELKTFLLKQFIRTSIHADELTLLYLYNNKIETKLVDGNSIIEGKRYNEKEQRFDNDDVDLVNKGSKINDIDYWYGNFFISYGTQNKTIDSDLGRTKVKVFFIDKINYR